MMRIMKHVLLIALVILAILSSGCAAKSTACLKSGKCVDIEVVSSVQDKETGLMKYDSISEDYGMLFIDSSDSDKCMWMKNMKFPIDIVWLDDNDLIVQVQKDAPACAIDPCKIYCTKSRNVLELKAGFADKYSLKILDKISIDIKK